MTERRMFAKSVISSARFLRMPQSSRLLYYDLGMAADDDGVVEAFTVLRTTGAAEDDLRVLASKGFVRVLNEDLVSFITDWRQNNLIRPDRYHPSVYAELLVKIADGDNWFTDGIPMVDERETQVRLGKDSTVEESIVEGKAAKPPRGFDEFWAAYPKKKNKLDAQRAFAKVKVPLQTLLDAVERQKQSDQWKKDGGQFVPFPATWLRRGAWEDEPDRPPAAIPDEKEYYEGWGDAL